MARWAGGCVEQPPAKSMTQADIGTFVSGPLSVRDAALFIDLSEITMAAS